MRRQSNEGASSLLMLSMSIYFFLAISLSGSVIFSNCLTSNSVSYISAALLFKLSSIIDFGIWLYLILLVKLGLKSSGTSLSMLTSSSFVFFFGILLILTNKLGYKFLDFSLIWNGEHVWKLLLELVLHHCSIHFNRRVPVTVFKVTFQDIFISFNEWLSI